MPTRREVVLSGAGLAAVAALVPMSRLRADAAALSVHRVLFDQRHAAAQSFAAAARTLGATVRAVQDDVHELWQSELYPRWRAGAVAIAGMTQYAALFCLEMVARDAGMQLVYRVNHRVSAGGHTHEAYGLISQLEQHGAFSHAPADWSRQAAERVLGWKAGRQSVAAADSSIAHAQRRSVDSNTLVTWLIAPVRASLLS